MKTAAHNRPSFKMFQRIYIDDNYADELWIKDGPLRKQTGPQNHQQENSSRTEINAEQSVFRNVPLFA